MASDGSVKVCVCLENGRRASMLNKDAQREAQLSFERRRGKTLRIESRTERKHNLTKHLLNFYANQAK
jgi:hypothetical protein